MLFDGAAPIDDDCKVDKMMRNKLHSASKVGRPQYSFHYTTTRCECSSFSENFRQQNVDSSSKLLTSAKAKNN